MAARHGLAAGSRLTLNVAGDDHEAFVAGLLAPGDALSARALDGLILADIATAQELTGRLGKLDRIDLIVPEDSAALLGRIEELLPPGASVRPAGARTGALEQMTAAFRTNLTALSLLALVVGLFLIYNTVTFSVVKRRPLFGTLRCLGVTRQEVFFLVVGEALVVGLVGSVLGVALGIVLGQATVRMVSQTINDLYFVVNVAGGGIPASSLARGAVLGVMATVLTAVPPAWEAASVPPRAALDRSVLEGKARRAVLRVAIGGAAALAAGAAILALPIRNLAVSFAGTFAVIVGFAMLTPLVTVLLMRGLAPVSGRLGGTLGRMAPRGVVGSLSRTSVAVAALMVAVSVTIGVNLMVSSFRHTVVTWLDQSLQGDIYISAHRAPAAQNTNPVPAAVIDTLQSWPGVVRVDTQRSITVDSPDGPISLTAVDNPNYGSERIYLLTDRPTQEIWSAMQDGAVVVSEPLANRLNLPFRAGRITLNTDSGPKGFPIIGVYSDYTSSQGTVSMSSTVYRQHWSDDSVTALALRLEPGADTDQIARDLENAIASAQGVLVRPNKALRQEVLVIFDRTFAITGALQMLATLVAFIGVLSALLSVQLDKQREVGILRAVGLTARQLWVLLMLETGLLGMVAGILAMPTGYVLSLILVYIINRRSFGWTLQMQVDALTFLEALVLAVSAALLAGIYPARRMGTMIPVEALRNE